MKGTNKQTEPIYELFGWEFRKLRKVFGYSAREFAEYLAAENAPITSSRSVYRLEEERFLPLRYIESFKRMVGVDLFNNTVTRLRNDPGQYREGYLYFVDQEERVKAHYSKQEGRNKAH